MPANRVYLFTAPGKSPTWVDIQNMTLWTRCKKGIIGQTYSNISLFQEAMDYLENVYGQTCIELANFQGFQTQGNQ